MYQAIYKCRLCGEKFFDKKIKSRKIEDFSITNILAQIEQTVLIDKPNRADLHRIHNCKDGSCGFSDFQGFEKLGGQGIIEVIYISPSCKQAVNFIDELAVKLKQNGIEDFDVDHRNIRIESYKFIVSAVDIFGGKLGLSHHMTKYYIDKSSGASYANLTVYREVIGRIDELKRTFRDGTMEISEEELIEILTEVSV